MGRLLRRNIWIEAGISLFLMLFFIYFYCHIDQWVIETLPSTISPAFFPSVVIGLHFIGFVYSTPIVMFLVSLMLGLRHWLIGIVCYVLFTLLLNYVAFNFMQIILPTGVLFG